MRLHWSAKNTAELRKNAAIGTIEEAVQDTKQNLQSMFEMDEEVPQVNTVDLPDLATHNVRSFRKKCSSLVVATKKLLILIHRLPDKDVWMIEKFDKVSGEFIRSDTPFHERKLYFSAAMLSDDETTLYLTVGSALVHYEIIRDIDTRGPVSRGGPVFIGHPDGPRTFLQKHRDPIAIHLLCVLRWITPHQSPELWQSSMFDPGPHTVVFGEPIEHPDGRVIVVCFRSVPVSHQTYIVYSCKHDEEPTRIDIKPDPKYGCPGYIAYSKRRIFSNKTHAYVLDRFCLWSLSFSTWQWRMQMVNTRGQGPPSLRLVDEDQIVFSVCDYSYSCHIERFQYYPLTLPYRIQSLRHTAAQVLAKDIKEEYLYSLIRREVGVEDAREIMLGVGHEVHDEVDNFLDF